mgnify:CR=1 FL=1
MMKRRRALALALLLLLTVLTACGEPYGGTADTSAGPSAGAGEETAAPDGGAEPLSPEDVRDLFADAAQENGYTVLGCTAVDDGACSLAGVVLHTTAENDVTRLAFLDTSGNYQTCGVGKPPSGDGALVYLGDARVEFQVWDPDAKISERYVLSYAVWPEESRVGFTVESVQPVPASS